MSARALLAPSLFVAISIVLAACSNPLDPADPLPGGPTSGATCTVSSAPDQSNAFLIHRRGQLKAADRGIAVRPRITGGCQ